MNITKSKFLEEVAKGGSTKEIAERLGISLSDLTRGAKQLGINLRKKKVKPVVEFVDDTLQTPSTTTSGGTTITVSSQESIPDTLSVVSKNAEDDVLF